MTTEAINTLSHPEQSTPPSRCAAQELDGEDRKQLALHGLARTEPVTELAKRHQVSRKLLYRTSR